MWVCTYVCWCVCFLCFSRTSAHDPHRRLQQLLGWGVVAVFPWRRCLQVPGLHLHLPAAVPGGVPVQHRSPGGVSAAEQPQVRTRKHTNTQTHKHVSVIHSWHSSATWPKVYGHSYSVEALTFTLDCAGGLYDTLTEQFKSPGAPRPEPDLDLVVWVVSMETVNRKPCKYMLWLWYLQQQIIDRSNKVLACKYTETCVCTQCKY